MSESSPQHHTAVLFNRLVQRSFPPGPKQSPERGGFNDFLNSQNIILLGDPGSGKSSTFKQAAELENTRVFTARTFAAHQNSIPNGTVLYIDALDERRSRGRGEDWIENLVGRIEALQPTGVRISCRALDWLGETDLALFKPYFERNGSYTPPH